MEHQSSPVLGIPGSQAFKLGLEFIPLTLQFSDLLTTPLTFLGLQLADDRLDYSDSIIM